jgi:hypothetical protein
MPKNTSPFCYINDNQEKKVKRPLLILNLITFAFVLIIILIGVYQRDLLTSTNFILALIGLGITLVLGILFYFQLGGDQCTPQELKQLRLDVSSSKVENDDDEDEK